MKESIENESENLDSRDQIKKQVAQDLKGKFTSFVTLSAAYRAFERETGLSKRQAERYIAELSYPQFLNLKQIYTFITGVKEYDQLLNNVPSIIAKELIKKNTNNFLPRSTSQRSDFSEEIENCRAFSFIYWNTVNGNALAKTTIQKKFGEYGLKVLLKMEKLGIITKAEKNTYLSGHNRSSPINASAAALVSRDLIEHHFKPEKAKIEGNNFLGFQVFSLNEEAKRIALAKMENLHLELTKLAAQSQGKEEPFFTIICGDSMTPQFNSNTMEQ